MNKIVKGILIVFFGLILLGALVGNDTSDDVSSSVDTQPPTSTEAEEVTAKTYTIGDRVVVGDIAYTVTDAYTTDVIGTGFSIEEADGIFLIVEMTLENLGDESITITSDFVKAIDSHDRTFESDNKAWIYLENNLFLKQLQPGLPASGEAIFDVPPGETIRLRVQSGYWGLDTELIEIGEV